MDESTSLVRLKAQNDFFFFAKFILGYADLDKAIHKPICDAMGDAANRRLQIILPRSFFKSTICSIAWPIWMLVRDPNERILIVSNTLDNAAKKLYGARAHFEDSGSLLVKLWPHLIPKSFKVNWGATAIKLNRTKEAPEFSIECAGTGTNVTGRHYTRIIQDDTIAPNRDDITETTVLPDPDQIAQAIGFHKLCMSLLVNEATGSIIVVGTRWFERDLQSFITSNQPEYLKIERSVRETNGQSDPNGQITYPARFNEEVLGRLEANYGPYIYSALYLNRPKASEEMSFQQDWFSFYEKPPDGVKLSALTSVDLATDPETARSAIDYNVVLTTGKDNATGRVYLLDMWRAKANPGAVIDEIIRQVRAHRPSKVLIESVAYQKSMIYWVKERQAKTGIYFRIEGVTYNRASKGSRILGLQPVIRNGAILFKKEHAPLIGELMAWPLGSNDDCADCLAMQLPFWGTTSIIRERLVETKVDLMRPHVADEVADAYAQLFMGTDVYGVHSTTDFGSSRVDPLNFHHGGW